jgi:hypothetical protein
MMFQMATGRLPFPGTSFGEVLIGHLQLPPPRPRELVPAIPEAYEALILKCLEKKQEDRYQSMREVHDAIGQVMDQLQIPRELPVANAEEIAAASSGSKTRTNPGGLLKTPARSAIRPALPRKTPATPGRPMMTVATPPPPAPPRSRIGLYLGITSAAVVVVGGIVVFLQQQAAENQRAAERAAQIAAQRIADQAREAARRAEEEQRQKESERIQLSVVSDPVGAIVEATWRDGAKAAVTPFDLSVPKNANVRFAFSKKDFAATALDVVADAPKVVRAALAAEPKLPPARVVKSRSSGSEKGTRSTSSEGQDEKIPVEF